MNELCPWCRKTPSKLAKQDKCPQYVMCTNDQFKGADGKFGPCWMMGKMLDEETWNLIKLPVPLFGIVPTDDDMDWVENILQRHTGGIDEWWRNYCQAGGDGKQLDFRWLAQVIIVQWEMGRMKAGINPLKDK